MKRFKRIRSFTRRNAGLILFVLGMFCMRTGVADWSYVPTGSMEPTLYPGDWLLVSKRHYGPSIPFTDSRLFTLGEPSRGDVITFYPPHTDELFVKRVVGIPGDSIEVTGRDVYINGERIPRRVLETADGVLVAEERLGDVTHKVQFAERSPPSAFRAVVPEDKYFVMGDNRDNSSDSRFWGYVDSEHIVGKVTHVAASFSSRRPLSERIAVPVE